MACITIRRGASVFGASALLGLALAVPATAKPMPGPNASPGTVTHGQEYVSPAPVVKTITVDDGALSFLQIGGGALAGFALAGGAAVARSRTHHRQVLQG